ncbi:MAG TPA: hypothetical protein VL361_28990 [Candidatus Limnocylindrales bacterium]|nr:hypothetical protein [Candidatus Limnocylindrales bacterium]
MKIKLMSVCCVAALGFGTASPALANTNPDAAFFDAVLGRPVGFAATVIGSAAFVISLPFTAPSGSIKSTADSLVGKPGRFTFTRPLGDFSYPHNHNHQHYMTGPETAQKPVKRAQTVDHSKPL